MTSRRICLGLAVVACALDASAPAALVLEGATIVSSGRRRTAASIVIEGGRITAVGSVGQLTTPKGARVVDVRGTFIVPGLIDAHTHLGDGTLTMSADVQQNLARILSWGVTSIVDPGVPMEGFAALKCPTENRSWRPE